MLMAIDRLRPVAMINHESRIGGEKFTFAEVLNET
jgi:hypothetical protein